MKKDIAVYDGELLLSEQEISRIQLLIKDRQKKRLNAYPCAKCQGKMALASVWTCGSCNSLQNGKDALIDPLMMFRVMYHMIVMEKTPLQGCRDKYCTNPQLGAIQCPHCHTNLIFDSASYDRDRNAVAEVPPSIGEAEVLAHVATLVAAARAPTEEEAHQKELERLRREREIREAREKANPQKPNAKQDEADDIKDIFGGRGFGK